MIKNDVTVFAIAKRLLANLACIYVANLEDGSDAARKTSLVELSEWLQRENLDQALSASEVKFIQGALTPASCKEFSWLEEAVAVYGWALGFRINITDYEEQVKLDGDLIFDQFSFLAASSVDKLVLQSDLVDRALIRAGRNFYLDLLNRIDQKDLTHTKVNLGLDEKSPFKIVLLNGQIVLDGKPFKTASAKAQSNTRSIVFERYKAFSWLLEQL